MVHQDDTVMNMSHLMITVCNQLPSCKHHGMFPFLLFTYDLFIYQYFTLPTMVCVLKCLYREFELILTVASSHPTPSLLGDLDLGEGLMIINMCKDPDRLCLCTLSNMTVTVLLMMMMMMIVGILQLFLHCHGIFT